MVLKKHMLPQAFAVMEIDTMSTMPNASLTEHRYACRRKIEISQLLRFPKGRFTIAFSFSE